MAAPSYTSPKEYKPIHFALDRIIAKDCKIYVEMPCKGIPPEYKILNVTQFREHSRMIIFQDYMLKEIKFSGLEISEIHFRLMLPSDVKHKDGVVVKK